MAAILLALSPLRAASPAASARGPAAADKEWTRYAKVQGGSAAADASEWTLVAQVT